MSNPISSPQNLQIAAGEMFSVLSGGYSPPPVYAPNLSFLPGVPPFTSLAVDAMRHDYQVKLAISMKLVPIMKPQFKLIGDPEIVQFVEETIRQIWTAHITDITDAMWYTRFGAETVYKHDPATGMAKFDKLLPFHSRDIRILTRDREVVGLKIVSSWNSFLPDMIGSQIGLSDAAGFPMFAPKCFVYVHGQKFGSFEGTSELEGAYEPWMEKVREGGGISSRSLWFYKCAFDSGIVYHPPGVWVDPSTGLQVPNRDIALKIVESIRNGGGLAMENVAGTDGAPSWRYEPGQVHEGGEVLLTYIDHLDHKIILGTGIPDDVITQNSGTGSYAGRTIPFIAFLESGTPTVRSITKAIRDQILMPLIVMNYGQDRGNDWDITEAKVNVDEFLGGDEDGAGSESGPGGPEGIPGDGDGDGVPNEDMATGQGPGSQNNKNRNGVYGASRGDRGGNARQFSQAFIEKLADDSGVGLSGVNRKIVRQIGKRMSEPADISFVYEGKKRASQIAVQIQLSHVVHSGHDVSGESRASDGKWTVSGNSNSEKIQSLAKRATEKGWSAKQMKMKAAEYGVDFTELRKTAAELVNNGELNRPRFVKRHETGSRIVVADRHAVSDEEIEPNRKSVHNALTKSGAELGTESESGSRYYKMPNGDFVRVSDHEPNEATQLWMDRNVVHSVRIDRKRWQEQLDDVLTSQHLSSDNSQSQMSRSGFDESKHPRGQPENAGEFAPKPGGSGKPAQKKRQPAAFSEDKRLTSLSPSGPSWNRISRDNPGVKPGSERVTIYRATIGNSIRDNDYVALNRDIAESHLESLRDRGEKGRIISQEVDLDDLLMANDSTEFIYYPKNEAQQDQDESVKAKAESDVHEMIRPHVTNSPAFKAWFGDSKIVDQNGKPMVVYRGTQFSSDDGLGKRTQRFGTTGATFFSSHPDIANSYASLPDYAYEYMPEESAKQAKAEVESMNPSVSPVYLRVSNPLVVDAKGGHVDSAKLTEQAKSGGYDGLIMKNVQDTSPDSGFEYYGATGDVIAVFEPTQIKSAIGNKGTFDPSHPKINMSQQDDGHLTNFAQKLFNWDESEHPRNELGEFTEKTGGLSGSSHSGHSSHAEPHTKPHAETHTEHHAEPHVEHHGHKDHIHGPAGISRSEAIEKAGGKVSENKKLSHSQAIAATYHFTGTKSSDWNAAKITGMSEVEKGDGTGDSAMLPTFEIPSGYSQVPLVWEGSGENMCCGLCGHDIKTVYHIQNDEKRWTMPVGSECVTKFGEGKSGTKLAKEATQATNRDLLRQAWAARSNLAKKFGVEGKSGDHGIFSVSGIEKEILKGTDYVYQDVVNAKAKAAKIWSAWMTLRGMLFNSSGAAVAADKQKVSHYHFDPVADSTVTRWAKTHGEKIGDLLAEIDELTGEKQKQMSLIESVDMGESQMSQSGQDSDKSGHWITIGGHSSDKSGGDESGHGRTHVFISRSGKILKGPPGLKGENVGHIGKHAPLPEKERQKLDLEKQLHASGRIHKYILHPSHKKELDTLTDARGDRSLTPTEKHWLAALELAQKHSPTEISHASHDPAVIKHLKSIHGKIRQAGEDPRGELPHASTREGIQARQAHAKAAGKTGRDVTEQEAKSLGSKAHIEAHSNAKQAAKEFGVSVHDVLQNMESALKFRMGEYDQREAAKTRARQLAGLNAGNLAAIENRGGRDYSTVSGFDTAARSVAVEHPDLGFDPDDSDTPAKVWDLIREGKAEEPKLHDRETANQAAEWIRLAKKKKIAKSEHDPDEDTSFGFGFGGGGASGGSGDSGGDDSEWGGGGDEIGEGDKPFVEFSQNE